MSVIKNSLIIILTIISVFVFIYLFQAQNYLLFGLLISILSIASFYINFERNTNKISLIIAISIMVSIIVIGRLSFTFLPWFNPTFALIIISGYCFGMQSGFMIASLSAFVSNMFLGQGPWTIYQMLIWGIIGFGSGLLSYREWLAKPFIKYLYGFLIAIFFAMSIDFLTVIQTGFSIEKYLTMLSTAIPFTIIYVISTIIGLLVLFKPLVKKINRIKDKFGLVSNN